MQPPSQPQFLQFHNILKRKKKPVKTNKKTPVITLQPLDLNLAVVQAWIAKAVSLGLPETFITAHLKQSRIQPLAKKYMDPPPVGTRKNWAAYKARFTDLRRTQKGKTFLENYSNTFQEAFSVYGVPREIIAAIIGIETFYGQYSGEFKLLDVLPTLAFDYPRRAQYFENELFAFLQLVYEGKLTSDTKGSFAGAIGLPQFMPSSLQKYGVSSAGGAAINLTQNPKDAILSVAHFLNRHGWAKGLPIAFEAPSITQEVAGSLLKLDATPIYDYAYIAAYAPAQIPSNIKYAVVDLTHIDRDSEHLLTTQNFHAIMQYNRSYFYAAAVWYFAQKLGLNEMS